jgi:hypothetical protein
LLEEHYSNTDHGPSNDIRPEHVDPSVPFKLHVGHKALASLEAGMSHEQGFSVMNRFSPDRDPFSLNSWIGCWKSSEEAQNLQSFLISTFSSQPSR